jgi:hypothetical protein
MRVVRVHFWTYSIKTLWTGLLGGSASGSGPSTFVEERERPA